MEIEKCYQQIADTFSCFGGKDKKKAFYALQREANAHNASALYIMGLYFEGGYGVVPIDKECAENYYQKAAEAGDAVALLQIMGDQSKVDSRLFKKVRILASKGACHAQDYLGWCYSRGVFVDKSVIHAIQWFKRGAAQGYAAAQNHLGEMYIQCMGGPFYPDDSLKKRMRKVTWRNKAFIQYHRAAAQEYAPAQCNMGWQLVFGNDPFYLENTHFTEWYQKAAEQGMVEAQEFLGTWFSNGDDFPFELAMDWLEKAAFHGAALAQWALGVRYEDGDGFPQSYELAAYWFHQAALQGEPYAQYRLGILYDKGRGVPQSDEIALYWLHKAETQGFREANDYIVKKSRNQQDI
jgi:TPR repeat protein